MAGVRMGGHGTLQNQLFLTIDPSPKQTLFDHAATAQKECVQEKRKQETLLQHTELTVDPFATPGSAVAFDTLPA